MPEYIHKCKNKDCGKLFRTDNTIVTYCSLDCQNNAFQKALQKASKQRNDNLYKDVQDIPVCKICGFKSPSLIQHIRKIHNMSQKKYMRVYKAKRKDIYHHSYTDNVQEKGKGDKAICKYCNAEFTKLSPYQVYCSDGCRKLGLVKSKKEVDRRLYLLEKEGKHTPGPRREKTCKQCGKTYNTKHPHSHYCTKRCRNKWYYENNRKPKQIKKIKYCKQCNKEITNPHKILFCSPKCRKIANEKKDLKHAIRESIKKYEGVKDIPVCKICGYMGKMLNQHIVKYHKLSTAEYCRIHDVEEKSLVYVGKRERHSKAIKKIFDKKIKEALKRTLNQA